jgi:hypothetical protein
MAGLTIPKPPEHSLWTLFMKKYANVPPHELFMSDSSITPSLSTLLPSIFLHNGNDDQHESQQANQIYFVLTVPRQERQH